MSTAQSIFVDSDAFVALARNDDTNHARAQKILKLCFDASVRFSTSNFVIAEAATVISMRVGHEAAVEFLDQLHPARDAMTVYWVTEEVHGQALEVFKNQKSKNVSFIDCTNIVLARQYRIDGVLSFDKVYKKNGLKLAEQVI